MSNLKKYGMGSARSGALFAACFFPSKGDKLADVARRANSWDGGTEETGRDQHEQTEVTEDCSVEQRSRN